jgi:pimeloyl-ACP methyl ester carboxylesterase
MMKMLRNEKTPALYYEKVECERKAGIAMIFLHGIAGSRRVWDKSYKEFARDYTLYFVDLLGFGYSGKPTIEYTLENHVNALEKFVTHHVKEPSLIFVGHSLGAIVSLGYGHKHPSHVKYLFLLGLPYYESQLSAIEHITASTRPSYFARDTWLTKLTCNIVCSALGPLTRRVAPWVIRGQPPEVTEDGFLHTYNSYISTLYNVIYRQNIPSILNGPILKKIVLIHGEKDKIVPLSNIKDLLRTHLIPLSILIGENHMFPILVPKKTVTIIEERLKREGLLNS